MTGSALADQGVRDLIRTRLDETVVVEAAAGTGKTTQLVHRILRVLATGTASVRQLVAVTFTEKAAGELKLRLRRELETARHDPEQDPDARRRLEEALANLEEAHISTIHGFCADLLRERPVEARIDPLFSVLTEARARRLYDEAFDAWFQDALGDTPEGVRRSLRRSTRPNAGGDADDDGPVERLRRAGWDLAEWRDFPESWTRPPFARAPAIASLTAQVHAFAALTAQPASRRDSLFLDTSAARRASDELRLIALSDDDDAAEAVLIDLCRDRDFRRARKGSGASFARGVARADVHAAYQSLLAELDAFKADADADLAALLRDELRGSIDRYQHLKSRAGALDFLDLLLCARNLVAGREEVRRDFQQRFTCLFVDEFQDTDPLQAEILLLLSADDPSQRDWLQVRPVPGKLFIVGDPKQSIYRFRRADVAIYRQVCEQLARHGALSVRLTTSFRSVPALQRFVNAAFGPRMTGDRETLQADYVPLAASRPAIEDQPAIVALPVPEPYGKRNLSGASIDKSLPDAVGAYVDWLVNESGWTVTERGSDDRVPLQARHVCLLFRRFVNFGTDVTRAYVDALEARGIKHLLVGGRAFHGREEIETLRAALAAIEWPDDELSVFATLRGALFAIGDEELLEYRHAHPYGLHPFRSVADLPDRLAPIGEALRLLAELHRRRNRLPVADTIAALFDATRAHVGFALRRAGEQVLANALHVAELARQYELSGGISFRGFVEALRESADEGQATEAPIVEEGSDGVRLMTVHKAKGLEFPVVILADMTAKIAPAEAARHLDSSRRLCALRIGGWSPRDLLLHQPTEHAREVEEGVRVAYVAATRARDLLVVPAIGDQPWEGWIEPLNAALYPAIDRRRMPLAAPRCPTFRKDSVLRRPDDAIASSATVCPGRHRFAADRPEAAFDVVWWDPSALHLGAEPPFGLRRQELISKDVPPEVVAEGQRRYIAWREGRKAALAAGGAPAHAVRTTTEWAMSAAAPSRDIDVIALDARPDRPSGTRYGALVHAVLACTPLSADPATLANIVDTQARIVAADDRERASAHELVVEVLRHDLFDRARSAEALGTCFRETPITVMRDGTLIEGVVDLTFEDDAGVVVIDFKTDRGEGDLLDRYRRQVSLYADALAEVTGRPVRAVLLKI
jgi:ATP-dependent exoDNAse (exonuclease V) beta subunit